MRSIYPLIAPSRAPRQLSAGKIKRVTLTSWASVAKPPITSSVKRKATAARASDDFLSRLQQAEARDAADRPTGAEDPRHALPPRSHMEAAQKNAQLATHQPYSRAGMQQVILPKTAYDHSAAYRAASAA